MRMSIAQVNATTDKETNLEKAEQFIEKASRSNADLVMFPEFYMCSIPPSSKRTPQEIAEKLDGPFVTRLKKAAIQNNIYVACGMYERSENGERAYNTVVVIDKKGELITSYRKTHLCDAWHSKESDQFIPGDKNFTVIQTEMGKIGLFVCYELRFPEIARQLVIKKEVDFILVPAAWYGGILKEDHWEVLLRARAIENTVYVCAVNQANETFSGRSMIVDPMGTVLASMGEEEGIAIADLSLDRIKRVRLKNPCLEHRIPELYEKY